ncbi:hypothetical protein AAFC00_000283 [Neodothiora populina]|uniref:Uncharacterized protein n=1 Tax=Neodothiora populina TaxID=2781224 RepID=A0ABR3PCG3_9PEZI
MSRRKTAIPPLLEPYLGHFPPEASLSLLTGVLNASPHWLTVRVLRGAYDGATSSEKAQHARATTVAGQEQGGEDQRQDGDGEDVAVVLVSWMRDWEFWKAEARRGAGLDLARLAQHDEFAFIDGLTGIFSTSSTVTTPSTSAQQQQPPRRSPVSPISPAAGRDLPQRTLPLRNAGPIPSRQPPPAATSPQASPIPASAPSASTTTTTKSQLKNLHTLTSPSLTHAQETITSAIAALSSSSSVPKPKKILLILDSPTTTLIYHDSSSLPQSQPQQPPSAALSTLILSLRSLPSVHSAVISLEIDSTFLAAATLALSNSNAASSGQHDSDSTATGVILKTPLETEMSRFVVGLAHAARWIVGVRGLDTGVAKDVTGVLRVTRGGAWDYAYGYDYDNDHDDNHERLGQVSPSDSAVEKELEVLYFVQPDGGVAVFERGAGNIG